jgi:AAA domain
MLSILGRCEEGNRLAHDWSRPYPGYSHEDTEAKLTHAPGAGRRTYTNFATLSASRYCQECPSWGKIKGPMSLGYARQRGDGEGHGSRMELTSLGDLLQETDEELPWLEENLLPSRGFSLLAGKPKAGKSTFARCLALAVARGECFLGRATTKGPVLYLALEEKRSEVRNHFREMGAKGDEYYNETAIFAILLRNSNSWEEQ